MEKLLPLLLLLACPLMMIFMMKGMHGGGGHENPDADRADPQARTDRDRRIAELEREVARLRDAGSTRAGGADVERSP